MNSLLAKSSFIEKSFECFADLQGFGAKATSLRSVINGAEGELVLYGPGTEGTIFAEEFCAEVGVFFVCYPLHTV